MSTDAVAPVSCLLASKAVEPIEASEARLARKFNSLIHVESPCLSRAAEGPVAFLYRAVCHSATMDR